MMMIYTQKLIYKFNKDNVTHKEDS
jgi:hypothetical protein